MMEAKVLILGCPDVGRFELLDMSMMTSDTLYEIEAFLDNYLKGRAINSVTQFGVEKKNE